jgi:hypothetical protein
MPIDQSETAKSDGYRIDLGEPAAIQAWCTRLVCTEGELREAVATVGSGAAKVMVYIDALRWNAKRRGAMIAPPTWMADE